MACNRRRIVLFPRMLLTSQLLLLWSCRVPLVTHPNFTVFWSKAKDNPKYLELISFQFTPAYFSIHWMHLHWILWLLILRFLMHLLFRGWFTDTPYSSCFLHIPTEQQPTASSTSYLTIYSSHLVSFERSTRLATDLDIRNTVVHFMWWWNRLVEDDLFSVYSSVVKRSSTIYLRFKSKLFFPFREGILSRKGTMTDKGGKILWNALLSAWIMLELCSSSYLRYLFQFHGIALPYPFDAEESLPATKVNEEQQDSMRVYSSFSTDQNGVAPESTED